MTAFTLTLKNRPSGTVLNIPMGVVEEIIESGDREKLWNSFKMIVEKNSSQVHDKRWLEMIINWTPREGLPMTEGAKWLKLAVRVGNLDDEKEGSFTLSQEHVNQIWSRVTNSEFKINNLSPAWAAFILDFQEATEKHFTDEDKWEEEQQDSVISSKNIS